jgi:hypothetical protein
MSKLRVSTREIGSVSVFDIEGEPTQDTLQEVAWKIQRNIRRHRIQRLILNLQHLPNLDPLGLRKLLAACIRPQRSLIYGACASLVHTLEDTYIPRNMRVCRNEEEVAEDFGPFLLERDREKEFQVQDEALAIGNDVERRRSKRMHVAIPLELSVDVKGGPAIVTKAIATNISEGGLFAEYLDLDASQRIEGVQGIEGLTVGVHIFPNPNFSGEYQVKGRINRKELRKKQLGLAIEFLAK